MARKIVFTSGKGGVGKTTLAVNLGARLARLGEQVVICDVDFALNNVDVAVGVEGKVLYDLADVAEGRCRARQALVQHDTLKNLYVLTGRRGEVRRYLSAQELKNVLDGLAPQFDYILIDCPAGVEEGFHRAVAAADEAVVVTTPHLSALRDADKVISILKSYQLKSVQLAVNMVREDWLSRGSVLSPQEISEILKVPLVAALPYADEIFFDATSDKLRAFRAAADNLSGRRKTKITQEKTPRGLFGGLKNGAERGAL